MVIGNRSHRSAQFISFFYCGLMTARTMPAAVACFFTGLAGSAAAGIAKFLGGRAFIPEDYALFMVLVNLSACAGVFGAVCFSGYCLILVGCVCSWF